MGTDFSQKMISFFPHPSSADVNVNVVMVDGTLRGGKKKGEGEEEEEVEGEKMGRGHKILIQKNKI